MFHSTQTSQFAQDRALNDRLIRVLAGVLFFSGLLVAAVQVARTGVPGPGAVTSLLGGIVIFVLQRAGQYRLAAVVFVLTLLLAAVLVGSYVGPSSAHWVTLPVATMVAGWLLAPRVALFVALLGVCIVLACYGLYLSGHVFVPSLVEAHVALTAIASVVGAFVGVVTANSYQMQLRKNAELEVELQGKLIYLNNLMRSIPELIWLKDPDGVYVSCNVGFERLYGAREADIVGKSDEAFVDKAMAEFFRENDRKALNSDTPLVNEEFLTFADGYQAVFETIKTRVVAPDGKIIGVLGLARDISERKRLEETLHSLAFYDNLTQLPNRRLLMDRFEQALRHSQRSNSYGALLFLDLNRFKQLNDTHGHDAGDMLLIEVAKRLRALVRETDTVARMGGDEFVVVLEDLGAEHSVASQYAESVSAKIKTMLSEEYVLGAIQHQGSVSVGTTLFLGVASSAEQLIKRADSAMYAEKKLRDLSRGA